MFFLFIFFLPIIFAQCPRGYTMNPNNDKCFLAVSNVAVSFLEAQRNCSARGGSLAVIENAFDNTFVKSLTRDIYAYWMGLANMGAFGWTWIDGTQLAYHNWEINFPSSTDTCGMFDPISAVWYSTPCVDLYGPYVCSAPTLTQLCSGPDLLFEAVKQVEQHKP